MTIDPTDFAGQGLGPCTPGDEEWHRRMAVCMAQPITGWWWLSFADPDRPKGEHFLGLCIVPGGNPVQAGQIAWALGCNPGGQVAAYQLDSTPRPEFVGRLFLDPEAAALSKLTAVTDAFYLPGT